MLCGLLFGALGVKLRLFTLRTVKWTLQEADTEGKVTGGSQACGPAEVHLAQAIS